MVCARLWRWLADRHGSGQCQAKVVEDVGDERGNQRTIEAMLRILIEKVEQMSAELDRLTASVAAETSKTESLITLVNGLAQIIRDNVNNAAALTALADSLDAETGKIQAAIDANTSAAPSAPPAPAPPAPATAS